MRPPCRCALFSKALNCRSFVVLSPLYPPAAARLAAFARRLVAEFHRFFTAFSDLHEDPNIAP